MERLSEPSSEAVSDINRLLPQLKPSWSSITLAELVSVLESPTRVYVARVAGRIVALTLMVPHRHFGGLRFHVEDVVVDEGFRRRNVAQRLIEAAIADAPDEVVSFDLRSNRVRRGAHELYKGLGFEASDSTVFRRLAHPR